MISNLNIDHLLVIFHNMTIIIPLLLSAKTVILVHFRIRIRIRKSFIAKCVCTHKEFVLVLGASGTETIHYKQRQHIIKVKIYK